MEIVVSSQKENADDRIPWIRELLGSIENGPRGEVLEATHILENIGSEPLKILRVKPG